MPPQYQRPTREQPVAQQSQSLVIHSTDKSLPTDPRIHESVGSANTKSLPSDSRSQISHRTEDRVDLVGELGSTVGLGNPLAAGRQRQVDRGRTCSGN